MVSRIKQLLEWQQLSPTQFADRIGVGRPVVSHILSGRNKPSLDVTRSIKTAFPELSYDWLLEGIGNMLLTPALAGEPEAAPAAEAVSAAKPAAAPLAATLVPASPATPASSARGTSATGNTPGETATPAAAVPQPFKALAAGPAARLQPLRFRPTAAALPVDVPAPPAELTAAPEADTLVTAGSPAAAPAPVADVSTASAPRPAAAELVRPPDVPTAAGVPDNPGLPAAAIPPAASPVAGSPPLPTAAAGVALAALGEPGKAIRRIVIFYRDGSFADYQPES